MGTIELMTAIKVNDLTVGYQENIIIDNMTLSIKKGAISTIIGENGSGKSTLLKTIGRVLRPKKGNVSVNEKNIHHTNTKEIAKIIGLLPQSPTAPQGLTVQEIVEYGRFPHKKGRGNLTKHDHEIVEWAIEKTGLIEFKNRSTSQLSGGQRQRVWIAMVLAQETEIMLLDEPTTYLDMSHQLDVLKLVQDLNKEKEITVVMVLHDINHASRFSDELIMIRDGHVLVQGSPYSTMTKENLRKIFHIEANIVYLEGTQIPVCLSYDNC